MPEGVVTRSEGPESKQVMGQINCANGDIISFFNTKNLRAGEPVIFDVIRTKLVLKASIDGQKYDYTGIVPVAVIPHDFDIDEKDSQKKWPEKLRQRWEEEWKGYGSDEEIEEKLGIKLKRSVKKHPHCK